MANDNNVSWTQQETARKLGVSARTLVRWRQKGLKYGTLLNLADSQLITAKQLAVLMKVSRSTVYRWYHEDVIKGYRINRTIRFQADSIKKLLIAGEQDNKWAN